MYFWLCIISVPILLPYTFFYFMGEEIHHACTQFIPEVAISASALCEPINAPVEIVGFPIKGAKLE